MQTHEHTFQDTVQSAVAVAQRNGLEFHLLSKSVRPQKPVQGPFTPQRSIRQGPSEPD